MRAAPPAGSWLIGIALTARRVCVPVWYGMVCLPHQAIDSTTKRLQIMDALTNTFRCWGRPGAAV